MIPLTISRQDIALGAAYFVAASLTVSLTRYDGGVAFLWVATAIEVAVLMTRPRRQWGGALLMCAIGGMLATGLFGFGWKLAAPMGAVNTLEAYVAARVLRQFARTRTPLGSIPWLWHFLVSAGIAGPAVAGALAALVLTTHGIAPEVSFLRFFAGHALGNLTFIPLISLVLGGNAARHVRFRNARSWYETAGLLALTMATTLLVFGQRGYPLLFLPMLPLILITFRLGEGGAAAGIVIVALFGGALTLAGWGPITFDAPIGERIQFFQLYLAATVLTVLPVSADLRQRARLHRKVRLSEERYRLLAEHSSDILLHLEADGSIRFVSPSIRQLGGYDPALLIGSSSESLVAPEHRASVRSEHGRTIACAGETCTYEYIALTEQGERRWFETHSRAVIDENGRIDGVMCIVRDISERKARELNLAEAAMTDALTGLPNRRAFALAVEARGPAAGRASDCLALIDIDHFKRVNDVHGHDAGDAVLRAFGVIARRHMRQGDTVARIGGEEFAILLPATTVEQGRQICDRLREETGAGSTRFGGADIRVTISGGVAPLGEGGLAFALRVADAALYRAKRAGRDQLAIAA